MDKLMEDFPCNDCVHCEELGEDAYCHQKEKYITITMGLDLCNYYCNVDKEESR